VNVVTVGLNAANEDLLFAKGAYGDGMFVTEPLDLQIKRLLSNGTLTTFATLENGPVGPLNMTCFQGSLLVGNGSSGHFLRVDPDGTGHVFASIPLPQVEGFVAEKEVVALSPTLAAKFGAPLLAGNFPARSGISSSMTTSVSALW
jgi:hypothetical protein